MISYHPDSSTAPVGTTFTSGFKVADTDDIERIAKGIARYAWSPSVWKDGYRLKTNFLRANWFALDFDTPELPLAQAVRSFCDMIHIIGTTRNHQKDKEGLTCDRYRILLKADKTVESLAVFESNMRRLLRRWPIDPACCEGGRHYFKCMEIVSIAAEGYCEEVTPADPEPEIVPDARAEFRRASWERTGRLPPWIDAFLKHGRLIRKGGRNNTIHAVAMGMAELGISKEDVIILVKKAPISREGLEEVAVLRTIDSAFGGKRG